MATYVVNYTYGYSRRTFEVQGASLSDAKSKAVERAKQLGIKTSDLKSIEQKREVAGA